MQLQLRLQAINASTYTALKEKILKTWVTDDSQGYIGGGEHYDAKSIFKREIGEICVGSKISYIFLLNVEKLLILEV